MLLLLPPSETKRAGGSAGALELDRLRFPELRAVRDRVLTAAIAVADDVEASMHALRLSPRQAHEVDRNRELRRSPTLPAIERYTGVLFDALDAASLDVATRRFAGEHLAVHSALFGLVGAEDLIPAYRLSHDSRLPELRMKLLWRAPIAAALERRAGLIVDLRSEGYADLGPAPSRDDSVYLRVVSADASGRRRALNHFNKRAKGLFTRALLRERREFTSVNELVTWARNAGFTMDLGARRDDRVPRELELVA